MVTFSFICPDIRDPELNYKFTTGKSLRLVNQTYNIGLSTLSHLCKCLKNSLNNIRRGAGDSRYDDVRKSLCFK